jgi:hypothetical protein
MPLGEYLIGTLFFVPTLGAALAVGWLCVSRQYRHLPALPRLLAFSVVATAALVFAEVIPAALGILSRASALATALVLAGVAARVPRRVSALELERDPSPPPSGWFSVAIAVVAVAVVAIYEIGRLRVLATLPVADVDMLGFHLPGIARFIQSGSLWRVDQFLPGFATAQYPNDGDFLLLSAILPWRDLAFVRFVIVPFYALTAIGVYALALELRSTRAAAATMAAALVTVPALSLLALDGLPDAIALAMFAAGLVFLVRHARSRRRSELALAGLALGIAFGTKWYGTTAVAVVCVAWAIAHLLARRRVRSLAVESVTLIGMILAGGGIWLLRNLIESGNPIYPKAVSLFGLSVFPGSRGDVIDRYGYTIANYLTHPHVLRTYVYPAFKSRVGLSGAVAAGGLVIALAAGIRAFRARDGRTPEVAFVLALGIVAVGGVAEYVITPGSAYGLKDMPVQTFANVRWLMPAILIAAALTPRATLALGRLGPLLELAGLAGAINGIELGPAVPSGTSVVAGLIVAAVIIATLIVRRFGAQARWLTRWGRPRRAAAAAAVLGAIVVLVAVARFDERRFDARSYSAGDPTIAWIEAHAPGGARIGITGVWSDTGLVPTLPAFGPRLRNLVSYVGDRVRHSIHLPASANSFDAELARGGYGLLLIGLQQTGSTDVWAREAGYTLVAQSARLALYRRGDAQAPGRASHSSSRYSSR